MRTYYQNFVKTIFPDSFIDVSCPTELSQSVNFFINKKKIIYTATGTDDYFSMYANVYSAIINTLYFMKNTSKPEKNTAINSYELFVKKIYPNAQIFMPENYKNIFGIKCNHYFIFNIDSPDKISLLTNISSQNRANNINQAWKNAWEHVQTEMMEKLEK